MKGGKCCQRPLLGFLAIIFDELAIGISVAGHQGVVNPSRHCSPSADLRWHQIGHHGLPELQSQDTAELLASPQGILQMRRRFQAELCQPVRLIIDAA